MTKIIFSEATAKAILSIWVKEHSISTNLFDNVIIEIERK